MDGIKAMETTLKRKNLGTRIISTFLRLVLRLNNLIFKGCAMVTKCSPRYANICMGMFKERYIYLLIGTISKFYLRHFFNMDMNYRPAS